MKIFFVCIQFFIATIAFSQTTNVNWTNLVNTTASGNTLTKTGSNGWNAGASSTNILAANTNGYVEIRITQDNTHRFFGLTQSDDGVSFKDIDFSIFLLSDKSIRIYEAGSYKGSYGGYAIGDKIRVDRTNGKVSYKKNNTTLYTSTTTMNNALVVDATIYHLGGTIENAVCSFSGDSGGGCTDADNDGVCADQDCNDNNANLPAAPGTRCNDGNANTTNDVILADGCTCRGTIPACTDADNDGICADQDCNDNNANLPASPGTRCNDGNANTTNDVILADGCTCRGTVPACTDADNDGICADQDCNDNNANLPAAPGTRCNDANANTTNDVILADGCTCRGTIPACTDADNDGICADQDCNDNNANLPASPGTRCNDGNANTTNDVILVDGCTCAGTTPVTTTSSLWTNNSNHILYNGKVLIGPAGTAIPGDYNLYVTKGILAEKVRVALTSGQWADYVFAKNYHLNSLSYVESYINTHQHLPNVPSAKEVEEKGVDVGQMDATLLRQIEELYLHVIELNKKVEGLEEEVRILRKE